MFLLWFLLGRRRAINRRLGRTQSAGSGGVIVELVALALILYGIVSIPWLVIPTAVLFALIEVAVRHQVTGR